MSRALSASSTKELEVEHEHLGVLIELAESHLFDCADKKRVRDEIALELKRRRQDKNNTAGSQPRNQGDELNDDGNNNDKHTTAGSQPSHRGDEKNGDGNNNNDKSNTAGSSSNQADGTTGTAAGCDGNKDGDDSEADTLRF